MKEVKRFMEFKRISDEAKGGYGITVEFTPYFESLEVGAPSRPVREFTCLSEAIGYIQGLIAGIESATCGGDE